MLFVENPMRGAENNYFLPGMRVLPNGELRCIGRQSVAVFLEIFVRAKH